MKFLLKYLWYSICYPRHADFINEGIGIEARAARAGLYWRSHLENSKKFILDSIPSDATSILIIGAGTLLDIPFDALLSKVSKITLLDANPAVLHTLKAAQRLAKKQGVETEIIISDVTGRFRLWSRSLRSARLQSPSDQATKLMEQQQLDRYLAPHDVVVSANILSQLGVLWREQLERTYKNNESTKELYRDTTLLLEKEHLDLVSTLSKKVSIVLSDKSFMYYQKNLAHFNCEDALQHQLPLTLPGKHRTCTEGWFWHIAPQAVEQPDFGVIHDVFAYRFESFQ